MMMNAPISDLLKNLDTNKVKLKEQQEGNESNTNKVDYKVFKIIEEVSQIK